MPLVSKIVQQPIPRRELHAALWSIYLRLADVPKSAKADGARPLREALRTLASLHDAAPPTLTGTALWHLLSASGEAASEELARLLVDVLGLEFPEARRLQGQTAHAVFPPVPRGTLILDSDFRVGTRGAGASAKLEVCVEREFGTLESIVDPEMWPDECPLFWQDLRLVKEGVYEGTMSLPGEGHEPTAVVMRGAITRGEVGEKALGVTAKLRFEPNDRMEACQLAIAMVPELGRPGWTRIVHERTATFVPAGLRRYRTETLAYWMKSEIACLVL